jgi:hypothetical protein
VARKAIFNSIKLSLVNKNKFSEAADKFIAVFFADFVQNDIPCKNGENGYRENQKKIQAGKAY